MRATNVTTSGANATLVALVAGGVALAALHGRRAGWPWLAVGANADLVAVVMAAELLVCLAWVGGLPWRRRAAGLGAGNALLAATAGLPVEAAMMAEAHGTIDVLALAGMRLALFVVLVVGDRARQRGVSERSILAATALVVFLGPLGGALVGEGSAVRAAVLERLTLLEFATPVGERVGLLCAGAALVVWGALLEVAAIGRVRT